MIPPVVAIITCVAMALGLVSAGLNYQTIYDIEMDRHYVAVTEQQLAEQYQVVAEKLDDARRRNDTVAAAEYGTILNGITQVRNRSNVVAIGRQVEQRKQAFIDEQWSIFQANVAINIVSWGTGKIGFGKVTDTYMRGKNWPPGSNFAVWNPLAKQSERIILGSRPELVVAQFSDDLAEFMNAILNGFDVARTASADEDIRKALDASTFVTAEMEALQQGRPLPKDIGAYLAASWVKKVQKENPQIATVPLVEQIIFVREQSCQSLNKMWLSEQRDQVKAEALWEAMKKLECGKLAKAPVPSEPGSPAEEPPAPIEEGAAQGWVRDARPVINRDGDKEDDSFHEHKRFFKVGESAFSWKDSYVLDGEVKNDLSIEVRFDVPPESLFPGEEIPLTATFSGGGILSTSWPFSGEFAYRAGPGTFSDQEPSFRTFWDRFSDFFDPGTGYSYTPWDASFSGPKTYTWFLTVPESGAQENVFEVWVYWRVCPACNVTWTYRLGQ